MASCEEKIVNCKEKIKKVLNNIESSNSEILENSEKLNGILVPDKPVFDENIKIKINNIESIIKEYEKIETINEQIVKNNEEILNEQTCDKEEKEKLSKEKETIIEDIEGLKKGKIILQKEFPNYVITQLSSGLEKNINYFLSRTYDKYELVIEDKSDSIFILYGPEKKDCNLASGYERQIFNLATKYAFGKIQDLKLLIVDEIDSQGDIDNSLKMYNLLGSLNDMYSQIFVISHKPDVQELLCSNYNAVNFEFYNGEVQ
jgi:DNA repair exonuclease SbcCD ATPase subunit